MTTNSVWQALLPPTVIVVQATEAMWDTPATERERQIVERAVPRRQREYQAGRAAARTALRVLGVEGFDLLPDANRQPIWPAGVVGSLTHAAGHCAAAVASTSDVVAVGIDVEAASPLNADLIGRICSIPEQRDLGSLDAYGCGMCAKLIFSAKEAFYKAYFPAVGRFLDFLDVRIHLHTRGEFVAELCADAPEAFANFPVSGRFARRHGMIFTAVSVSSGSSAFQPANDYDLEPRLCV